MTGAGGGGGGRKGGEAEREEKCKKRFAARLERATFGANQAQPHLAKEPGAEWRALGGD